MPDEMTSFYARSHRIFRVFNMLCLIIMIISIQAYSKNAGDKQKNILFINSYGYDFETVPIVINEVSNCLSDIATIHYIFMNEKYISDEDASKQLSTTLDILTSEFKYDAIILGDDAAFDYAINNRKKYFDNIPLIYENINSLEKAEKYKNDKLITGVVEAFPIKKTLELAKNIQKNARQVIIITDGSISGSGSAQQVLDVQSFFPDLTFKLFDTSTMTSEAIQKDISLYKDDSILLYTVFNIDGSGKRYTLQQGIKLISAASNIPIYKSDEAGLGYGLLGGYMLSYKTIGKQTAELVIAALDCQANEGNTYSVGKGIYQFDETVLDKYKISKALLPKESIYINKTQRFYEKYGNILLSFVCCLALFLAAIFIFSEYKRRNLSLKLEIKEAANRAKTDFISKMSHDIRTPLNAILGMNTLALNHADDQVKVHEYLTKAAASGELLISLINDILDISMIESSKIILKPTLYKLQNFFLDIKNIFSPMCSEKGLEFILHEDAVDETVLVDTVRFNQIFYNLLSNSIKYTDYGGKIEFCLESKKQKNTLACHFIVSDTGCGMSAEFQKKMFQQFAQEGRRDVQGSGLGLSIVKNLVELMGGSIEVRSVVAQGTCIHVFLELEISEEANKINTLRNIQPELSDFSGHRVLLIEDNDINAEITQHILKSLGIITDRAENGKSGLQIFIDHGDNYYSLILMDNRMPVMSGMEASRHIRDIGTQYAKNIPIIALTADAFVDDLHNFKYMGMNDCLTKPFSRDKLLHILTKYMS